MLKNKMFLKIIALALSLTSTFIIQSMPSTITYCGSDSSESNDYAEFWAGLESNGTITANFTPEEGVTVCSNAFCQYNYQQDGDPLYPTSISFDSGDSNFQLMYKGPTLTWTFNLTPSRSYSPGNYYFAWSDWDTYLSSISCDDAVAKASAANALTKPQESKKIPKPEPRRQPKKVSRIKS